MAARKPNHTASFIGQTCRELKSMAIDGQYEALAMLLEMAELEAANILLGDEQPKAAQKSKTRLVRSKPTEPTQSVIHAHLPRKRSA